ncbi:MAG: hypothetical protein U0795_11615 [Pirellulales bacterium]
MDRRQETAASIWERILAQIPGFGGYDQAERRRDTDAQTRQWILERLSGAGSGIDGAIKASIAQGDLASVGAWDQVRQKIDLMVRKMSVTLRPGEGIFNASRLDADALQDLYDLEADILDEAAAVAKMLTEAGGSAGGTKPADVLQRLGKLETAIARRHDLMAGQRS